MLMMIMMIFLKLELEFQIVNEHNLGPVAVSESAVAHLSQLPLLGSERRQIKTAL